MVRIFLKNSYSEFYQHAHYGHIFLDLIMIVYINHVINDGGVIGMYVNVDAEVSAFPLSPFSVHPK